MSIKEEIILHTLKLGNPQLLLQLLDCAKQLAKQEEEAHQAPFASFTKKINLFTVAQINSPTFSYKPIPREKAVGIWQGNESAEDLISMRTK
jgi:hypothetical protein